MFLQIDMNGLVSGTANCSSKFVQLELLSVGRAGLKMIKGVASGRYLAMNNKGIVYSTKQSGEEETLFVEKMQSSGYNTFASSKYYQKAFYDTFVAIKRNGRVKPGRLTNKLQKPAHFLILPAVSKSTC
ncbi:fibroblast growth factor 1-like [Actinia tenebrosa]|uniref:Fibroblast growth factor 1-like n=1 Tax=Actinia tenebrosa TaxID=6105 RepID=A0A6P8H8H0_ACTTE|nr:fibroblast growth factor 1-like [Actinia tenebrosa]